MASLSFLLCSGKKALAKTNASSTVTVLVETAVSLQKDEENTDEEDDDAPKDYIGDRLAHARLEATGQLYREV